MAKTITDLRMQLLHRLRAAETPQPELEARELAAFASHADKNKTAGWGHIYLDDATVDYGMLLCDRYLDGEPLAYILGEWDFYGLTLSITRDVLIPRPDTERVVDLALEWAGRRLNPRVLDLCCGSGCIGIAIASRVEDARVTAVDLSPEAVALTEQNAERCGVARRLHALQADARETPPALGDFDLIVSNPPYIARDEIATLERSVRDFEPPLALFGGEDGLDFYRTIATKWAKLLVPGGLLLFECGYRQARDVAALLEESGYHTIGISDDLSGIPRIVYGYV